MMVRIGRTLPPAAAPVPPSNVMRAFFACFRGSAQQRIKFEEELKSYFGQKYCYLVSSGKTALAIVLRALHSLHPERHEVLIPAFTCYSVPAAIKKAGLEIRLCDIDLETLNFRLPNLQDIASQNKSEKSLLCAVPTHLFGNPVDVSVIRNYLGAEVVLVEDAAQAMGTEWHGQKLGTIGDVGFFSLGRGKALSTMEGGVIITNRADIAEKIAPLVESLPEYTGIEKTKLWLRALLTTIFQTPWLFWLPKALPFLKLGETLYEQNFPERRFSSVQAAFSVHWQKRLEKHMKARGNNVRFWIGKLPQLRKGSLKWIHNDAPLLRFPLLLNTPETRDQLIRLNEQNHGLGLMPSYPTGISDIPELSREFNRHAFPNSSKASATILTIPVHEYVTEGDNRRIISILGDKET